MNDIQRVTDNVSALIAGWDEHIEYAVRINGGKAEARAKTVYHPALIVELRESSTVKPVGAQSERGAPNGPGSRPPGNMAPLHLVDTIHEESYLTYKELWYNIRGTTPDLKQDRGPELILWNLNILTEQAHEYPELVHDVARTTHAWCNRARVMLGYQRPFTTLAGSVCGECGGVLIVAADASTDVRCIGKDGAPACGTVYRQEDWVAMLPDLVTTDGAITYILGPDASDYERRLVRYRLINWAKRGLLTRHGGSGRGTARWDVREIDNAVQKAIA